MAKHELERDPEDPQQIKMFDDIDLAKIDEEETCPDCGENMDDCTCDFDEEDEEDDPDL